MKLTRLSFDKIFFHQERLAEFFRTGDCFPLQGIFGITNACNHRCVWCYPMYIGKTRDSIYFVDTKAFTRFLSDCKNHGMKSYMLVGSGEPTLHKGFCEILEHSRRIGLDVGLYTNGYRLCDAVISDSVLRNCTYVRVSLDAGTPETHEKLHGVAGHYKTILCNLRDLVSRRTGKFPTLGVQIAMNRENCHELSLIAGTCREIGVDYLSVKPVYADIIAKNGRGEVDVETFKAFMAEAEHLASDAFEIYAKYDQFDDSLTASHNNGTSYAMCQATPFILFADGDGSVYICPNRTIKFGNFLETPLADIWGSELRRQTIAGVNLHECPAGCHLHPLNKLLWNIQHPDPDMHPNFL